MSDLDENLTSILSSIVENESIDHAHPLATANNGLNLPSLTSANANDENARLKDIESITKSLQRAEDQLKQSQLEQQANGCEALVPSLSTELLSGVLDDSEAIAKLIDQEPIKGIAESVLGASIAFDNDLHSLSAIIRLPSHQQCAIINLPAIDELTHSNVAIEQFTENFGITVNANNGRNDGIENIENDGNCTNPSYAECEAIIESIEINSEFSILIDQSENDALAETLTTDRISRNKSSKDIHNSTKSTRTQRRRICVFNDSDSESELELEKSPISNEIEESTQKTSSATILDVLPNLNSDPSDIENEYVSLTEPSSSDDETNDADAFAIPNERPGPKSKKPSTILSAALKAKALLQSAVVIPANNKKKNRIIESDDEPTTTPTISVDDIGLIGDDNSTIPVDVAFEREDDCSPPVPKRKFVSRIQRGIGSSEPFLIKMVKSDPNEERPRRPPLNRMHTRIKFEQSDEYDIRNGSIQTEQSECDAIFDMPLNA